MPPPPTPASEFARIIRAYNLTSKCKIAVALSGGPDSSAIAHLVAAWHQTMCNSASDQPRTTRPYPVRAIIIDHALRPEASREAGRVGSWAKSLGLVPIIHRLTWPYPMPPTNKVMDQARTMRYNVLGNICAASGISHLLLGHHLGMVAVCGGCVVAVWWLCGGFDVYTHEHTCVSHR